MITIQVRNTQEALDLKNQVQSAGLMINQDFTWRYEPSLYDGFTHAEPPRVTFWFTDTRYETFFGLKWKYNDD